MSCRQMCGCCKNLTKQDQRADFRPKTAGFLDRQADPSELLSRVSNGNVNVQALPIPYNHVDFEMRCLPQQTHC